MDPFDVEKEKKILSSGVRDIFTPYQPIMSHGLFYGRSKEITAIIQQINTPGQHSVLFGDRGVGKSSLANVVAETLKPLKNDNLIKKRCDSDDTFITIIEKLLNEVGIDLQVSSSQQQKAEGGKAGIKIPVFDAGVESKSTDTVSLKGVSDRANSPSWVAEKVKDINALFLLDEIDVIGKEEKWKVAELVKQLSDEGSPLKFLIVGIAETASELTHGHKSVQRCLKETPLPKLSDSEVKGIIEEGGIRIGVKFSQSAIRKIVNVSAGYAHFTHLLSLKASEKAIGEGRGEIALGHIQAATDDACGDAEGVLRTAYNEATRSSNTEEFRKILIAASSITDVEFKSSSLRLAYERLWGVEINQGWLNNYLQKIVSDGNHTILRRLAKGVYKFNDPRMPSYIRLANLTLLPDVEQENAADR
ncbi:ATP-binding protein [Ectothiorhodospira lacustris]|uniref:ATP-binding protein n=1 Tax=Ectothiorhodospira lacustris TaxID=2899127 RepID=UPI001EE83AC5|nr:ATP-binding protein [Ectothiorhodospira lacustris]MCG5510208.1 ATP-binding protein [Ectothiorhodospira lacustris]MCG5521925.1 ATP-binding protein [Ectothiorhodospira lacustris]